MTTTTFICNLPQATQDTISSLIKASVEGPYLCQENIDEAMCGRVCDLSELSNYHAVLVAFALTEYAPSTFPVTLAYALGYAFNSADLAFDTEDGTVYNELSDEYLCDFDIMDQFFSHYHVDSWEYDAIASNLQTAFEIMM